MSYVVTVKRADGEAIRAAEVRALIAADATLREVTPDSSLDDEIVEIDWYLDPDGASVPFTLADGEISATTPSNQALGKLQEIAKLLNAQVVGEEAEDLTDVDLPPDQAPGCGRFLLTLLFLGGAIAIYWAVKG